MATSFLDLQNGFYNALSQGLGFPPGSPFQILQPSSPLVNNIQADQLLWNYFNNIPPAALTQNYIASGGNQFFSNYKGLLSALQGTPSTFQQDIGDDVFQAWLKYLGTLTTLPAPSQLGTLFYNWASIYYPSVAIQGASDLNNAALDPIVSAQMEVLMVYGSKPPDWVPGMAQLVAQLSVSEARSVQFSSSTMNSDVSSAWAQQSTRGLFGLWGGSSSSSQQSQEFASSNVSVDASFGHVTTFAATPGAWYSSAAMGLAFANRSGAPWKSGSPVNWNNSFDANNGNLARFASSLIVADAMNVVVQSDATFSQADQQAIQQNSGAGLWPFYNTNSSSGSSTSVSFNQQGHMMVHIATTPGVPVVIGATVIPVSQFVGHATEAAQRMAALLAA
jgi:hypothetical protein